jgi:hypothetical protein
MMSAMPINIPDSVGSAGVNNRDDVLRVQRRINAKLPIPLLPIPENGDLGIPDGECHRGDQRRNVRLFRPGGRVDPNGATFGFLTGRSATATSNSGRKYTNNPSEVVTRRVRGILAERHANATSSQVRSDEDRGRKKWRPM